MRMVYQVKVHYNLREGPPLDECAKFIHVAIKNHFLCIGITFHAAHNGFSQVRLYLEPLIGMNHAHLEYDAPKDATLLNERCACLPRTAVASRMRIASLHTRAEIFEYVHRPLPPSKT